MIVCVCSNISDSFIKNNIKDNSTVKENKKSICKNLNVGKSCGKCIPYLNSILESEFNKKQ